MKTNAQNAQRQENIDLARRLGRQAFDEGLEATPLLDDAFVSLLARHCGQGHSAIDVLDAWVTEWHRANVEAPVYLADGSVLELPK